MIVTHMLFVLGFALCCCCSPCGVILVALCVVVACNRQTLGLLCTSALFAMLSCSTFCVTKPIFWAWKYRNFFKTHIPSIFMHTFSQEDDTYSLTIATRFHFASISWLILWNTAIILPFQLRLCLLVALPLPNHEFSIAVQHCEEIQLWAKR